MRFRFFSSTDSRFILAFILGFSLLCSATPARGESTDPAMVIDVGSVARNQVVVLGRNAVVAGRAEADVAAVSGDVLVSGSVAGDVIVLSGNVRLEEQARVGGDVFVVGGTIDAAPGAMIEGRSVAYPNASSAWLALMEAPTLGIAEGSPLILGAKLALLTAWLALVLGFFAVSGRQVLSTSDGVRQEPFRCFAVGFVGVIAMLLTTLLMSLLAAALVGIPLLALVVFLAVGLKLWGMVAVFHALGGWISEKVLKRRFSPLNTATLGLAILGAIKLLPWIGLMTWHVATFIGVGAALVTKLGRRERWFLPEVRRA